MECDDPESCLQIGGAIEDLDWDFYISGGRTYEGNGWNCKARNVMRVAWLGNGVAKSLDMFSFNTLLTVGEKMSELSQWYEVFPACCIENNTMGPVGGVLVFLKTLPRFRDRQCLSKNHNCKFHNTY